MFSNLRGSLQYAVKNLDTVCIFLGRIQNVHLNRKGLAFFGNRLICVLAESKVKVKIDTTLIY